MDRGALISLRLGHMLHAQLQFIYVFFVLHVSNTTPEWEGLITYDAYLSQAPSDNVTTVVLSMLGCGREIETKRQLAQRRSSPYVPENCHGCLAKEG
jgi:hypothetical protein